MQNINIKMRNLNETNTKRQLHISDVWLNVRLGHTESEREKFQKIRLELLLEPDAIACYSDNLEDTVCYLQLMLDIEKEISYRSFSLIEHLTQIIAQIISNKVNKNFRLTITKYVKLIGKRKSQISFTISYLKNQKEIS